MCVCVCVCVLRSMMASEIYTNISGKTRSAIKEQNSAQVVENVSQVSETNQQLSGPVTRYMYMNHSVCNHFDL